MAYKFTYITVQHSATRFLETYFIYLGFSPLTLTQRCKTCGNSHGYEKHMDERNASGKIEYKWNHYRSDNIYIKPQHKTYPIVSTARHPYKTVISYLSRGYDVRDCLTMWDNFIKTSTTHNMLYYFTDCKEENRKAQLIDLIKSIDCYENDTEELTDNFVLDWKPIGVYNSDIKKEYERTGKLPDVFDWSRFDRAINWYEKRIEECKY